MKDSVTFLEMFGVGQVEQLNSLNRWKSNDPTKSLKTRIGYDENNDLFVLDLHEKQQSATNNAAHNNNAEDFFIVCDKI